MSLNFFPSKILLFGEYSILNGSKALAVPYDQFSGNWSYEESSELDRTFSRDNISLFLNQDWSEFINQKAFIDEFNKGLWFKSSIPQGYGLGSSGALVAGILSKFGLKKLENSSIKETLAKLEGHFHGSSSGLDPLVSFLGKPIKIHDFKKVEIINEKLNFNNFFLVNTNLPRKTGPLVEIYKEKLKDSLFQKTCVTHLSETVDTCIESYLTATNNQFVNSFEEISQIQWTHFQEMIPLEMREIWTIGMNSRDYFLKLCGAGGGGFLLGYSLNPSRTQNSFMANKISMRWLS